MRRLAKLGISSNMYVCAYSLGQKKNVCGIRRRRLLRINSIFLREKQQEAKILTTAQNSRLIK
jgi:hypothetical protein